MSEAIKHQPPKRGWVNVFWMGVGHFSSDFYGNVVTILLPLLAIKFGFSYAEAAAMFMIFQVTMNMLQPVVGYVADRRNLNVLMPASMVLGAFLMCALLEMSNVVTLGLMLAVSGICTSWYHPIAGAVLPVVRPISHPGLATSFFIAMGNIGFALGPLVTALFLDYYGESNLIWMAVPTLLIALATCQRRMHVKLYVKARSVVSFSEFTHNRNFVWFNIAIGMRSWIYCGFTMFIPLLLTAKGESSVESATALMVYLMGTAAGGLVAGTLSDYLPLRRVIMGSLILAAISGAGFLAIPEITWYSLVLLFVSGGAGYGPIPSSIVWAHRVFPTSGAFCTALMLGFTVGVGYVLCVFTGILADFMSLLWAMGATLIPASLFGALIVWRLPEPAKIDEE